MHRAALLTHRDPDVGARVDHGERLRPGLDTTGADALEPRSHVVGRDEIDHAGGVDEACWPGALRASPGENDEHVRARRRIRAEEAIERFIWNSFSGRQERPYLRGRKRAGESITGGWRLGGLEAGGWAGWEPVVTRGDRALGFGVRLPLGPTPLTPQPPSSPQPRNRGSSPPSFMAAHTSASACLQASRVAESKSGAKGLANRPDKGVLDRLVLLQPHAGPRRAGDPARQAAGESRFRPIERFDHGGGRCRRSCAPAQARSMWNSRRADGSSSKSRP